MPLSHRTATIMKMIHNLDECIRDINFEIKTHQTFPSTSSIVIRRSLGWGSSMFLYSYLFLADPFRSMSNAYAYGVPWVLAALPAIVAEASLVPESLVNSIEDLSVAAKEKLQIFLTTMSSHGHVIEINSHSEIKKVLVTLDKVRDNLKELAQNCAKNDDLHSFFQSNVSTTIESAKSTERSLTFAEKSDAQRAIAKL